ncbi:lysophospholipase-related [Holotrichia oblita]|uniref:Lysophospholipase-related n=2 Tax=Holotrichia oblita TaxID=644536 RepID=A0ACB9T9R6_HOLOL|nr:lysophospholipase-related [Holotrichia oblita]
MALVGLLKLSFRRLYCSWFLGDTGNGIFEWMKFLIGDFALPHLKFLFPTAPLRSYTPLNGEMSNVWFDRYDIIPSVPEHDETLNSIDIEIKSLIDGELAKGISLDKIIIGGFSMGGAMALHTAYRSMPGFAGVFALSSFLNDDSSVYKALQNSPESLDTPLIMFHGDRDTLVLPKWGRTTCDNLRKHGVRAEFHIVQNCLHELKKKQLHHLLDWINKILPEK